LEAKGAIRNVETATNKERPPPYNEKLGIMDPALEAEEDTSFNPIIQQKF